ncbi:MAG: glycerol-3-phosphate 1-O-acyltransferase PlsY [Betaproteobacteria bacterium]|nr:glycerol-3-phosphate 1-O-acyltransferase PlsY [Betaproteobacteria bacterium]
MQTIAFTLLAYLIGSVSFAVIVSRAFGLPDPRSYGSGNPGATNVLRTGRKAAAALTLLGDTVKGWLAVSLVQHFGDGAPLDAALAGVAAIVGHMYPGFFRFQGGKGVSTALGVLLALNAYLALGTVVTWLVMAFFFRVSSLAAIVSAVFAPFFCFLLYGMHVFTAGVTVIGLLLVWRHQSNIRNLIAGTESRLGKSTAGSGRGGAEKTD